jgi:nitrite reductase/ring-hydroxylating ferredoxin subunit
MTEFVPVMKASELVEGAMAPVDAKESHLLISRIGGKVYAVSGTCTHEDADLGLGTMLEERIVCPLHLSQFDLRDGSVLSPPAAAPLKRFNVKIQDETIFVEV